MPTLCPCCSSQPFASCCERFLSGANMASTPEQLMRSRYSAYALGGYGDYLLRTWFPATSAGMKAEELSEKSCDWQRLEVLASSQEGNRGMVEFKAHYLEGGRAKVMHEKSLFIRNGDCWFYVGGEVSNT